MKYAMKETKNMEYKERVTNTFLKTVSAYSNYGTGVIKFGITDNGKILGNDDPVQTCLDIENKVNDSISPKPIFELNIDNDGIVILTVQEGPDKPYLYKGRAYKRNDTSSVEVSRGELNRLTLQGTQQTYDEQMACTKDLMFNCLANELKKKVHIDKMTPDILKTLNLFSDNIGYNHAAELLADKNNYAGIDMVRFGKNINEIMERKTFMGESILTQLHQAISEFQKYYEYEKIDGTHRVKVETIPKNAFREAIANALVHRTWDIRANIKVSMFEDYIEISSPGSLPFGISEEEYLRGWVSIPRNPIIANVFFRLGYIEMFGTGIKRIQEAYAKEIVHPKFAITENVVTVRLPVLINDKSLSDDENEIISIVGETPLSKREILKQTEISASKLNRILAKIVAKGLLTRIGAGRATKYHR